MRVAWPGRSRGRRRASDGGKVQPSSVVFAGGGMKNYARTRKVSFSVQTHTTHHRIKHTPSHTAPLLTPPPQRTHTHTYDRAQPRVGSQGEEARGTRPPSEEEGRGAAPVLRRCGVRGAHTHTHTHSHIHSTVLTRSPLGSRLQRVPALFTHPDYVNVYNAIMGPLPSPVRTPRP